MRIAWTFLLTLGCAAKSQFATEPPDTDAGVDPGDAPVISVSETGTCTNLECQQVDCGAGTTTTVSGIVYDPAGKRPLYNVYVYVPNAPLEPIVSGNVMCSQCQAAASGSPLVSATTDAEGKFTINNVPAGTNIPLVMQVGKWRRQITIPTVTACANTALTDKNQTRLPSKSSEGDMPLIAFTSGCDFAECFLRRIGIDDSEFVAPGSKTGHVQFFTGRNGSSVTGGNTWEDTYQWWKDPKKLLGYDIIFNACECSPFPRNDGGGSGDAYQAMRSYVNGGGRLFTTHYFYNWFAAPTGPTDFQSVANWLPGGMGVKGVSDYYIDLTFPKGKAFGDWLQAQGITTTKDVVALNESQVDVKNNVGTVSSKATRWIYKGTTLTDPAYLTKYLTFNGPVGAPTASQCGRAVFSEFHLTSTTFSPGVFPSECSGSQVDHTNNEAALEFLFFDLSSCVQDASQPPPSPPPK